MTQPNELLDGFITNDEESKPDYTTLTDVLDQVTDNYKDASMEGLMKDLTGAKIMSMKEVINDIEVLIDEREVLRKEIFGDADKAFASINNFLSTRSQIDTVEEVRIREKLLDLETFKMQEKINAFRDIADLKKELRDRMQEFKEQESNATVLDSLLGS